MFDEKNNGFNANENIDNQPISASHDAQCVDNGNTNAYSNDNAEALDSQNVPDNEYSAPVVQEPIKVTDSRPSMDYQQYGATTYQPQAASQDYYGGVAYTKNVDGENKSGYEWNTDANGEKVKSKKEITNSGKGFKIFIGSVLTVFTISVLVLTAMVANQLVTNTTLGVDSTTITVDDSQKDKGVQITSPGVPASSSSYVAFDRTEYDGEILTIPQIAAKCSPSSVGIVSQVEVSYSYPFGFGSGTGVSEASGSGFIYSSDGYIITNHHVIEDAKKVTVILHNSAEYEAQIVGSDSLSDIAVLKINPDKDTPLIPMEIGNSDELVVGESVVAIGCPAGIEFIGTVTDGIVSAINRNVEISNDYGTNQKTMTLIQTNATINHGNSGGPLINTRGQVIGINTLKLSSSTYEGIGFSIPMNGAMPIIKQLIEHGKVIERTQDDFAYGKGVIGISGSAISEDESEYYNIPLGVLVVQIDKNSSAAKAGLRRGDIITHYNGKKVTSVDEINQAKGSARAGEQVTVTVYRDSENGYGDGETLDITFTLDAQS